MKPRFSLRSLLLAVTSVGVILWFVQSPVKVNREVASRIKPGMKLWEVERIIGGPSGNYDGVTELTSTYKPQTKSSGRSWVGFQGEIVVHDDGWRVYSANFYPGEVRGWSPIPFLGQRFIRAQYWGWSTAARAWLCLLVMTVLVFVSGVVWVPVTRPNAVATQGAIGLGIGAALALAFFSLGVFSDMADTTCFFLAPIAGSLIGIVVGELRRRLAMWRSGAAAPTNSVGELVRPPASIA